MRTSVTFPRVGAAVVALALGLAACGGSDSSSGEADGATDATTVESDASGGAGAPSAGAAVLEVSATVDVVGDALIPLDDPDNDPAVGAAAPVLTGQQFDGSDITIGGPTDQPTMLVFLAHWCPHCNDEIPELLTLRDRGDLPDGLDIIGISTAVVDDRENYPPSEWVVEKGWAWPILADTAAADAFQVFGGTGFPYTVLLDTDGEVIARKSGSESADRIQAWIDANLVR